MFRLAAASLALVACYASHEREPAIDARTRDGGRVRDADTPRDSSQRDASRDADSRGRDADTPPCSEARVRGEVRILGVLVDDERHRIAITASFWPATACRISREANCELVVCDRLPPEQRPYAGEITLSGSLGDVTLTYLDAATYAASLGARPIWEGGERVTVQANGGEFPPFEIAVDLPIPARGERGTGHMLRTAFFDWHPYAGAQIYLEAQRASRESTLFALCTAGSDVGYMELPPAVEALFEPVTYFATGGSRTIATSCSADAYVELVAHAEAGRASVPSR